jgi:gamma-glutamyltranspeptidase/glutathione hydrolase
LQPAIEYARTGFGASRALVDAVAAGEELVGAQSGWREQFMPTGRAPVLGEVVRYPKLASTLEAIAAGGSDEFYRGTVGRSLSAGVKAAGGLLAAEDLADCRAELLEPIATTYRGCTVFEQPPVSQGIILLLQLAILDGFDISRMGHLSVDAVHHMVEAKKLAFEARLNWFADPARHDNPTAEVLSSQFVERCRAGIRPDRAAERPSLPLLASAGGDTTFLATADAEGNLVAMIQSLFSSWGSGVVAGDTGVLLTNRLSGFFLDPRQPNCLEPGKRTIHTLNNYIVVRDGRPYLVGGTPGVDDQVQINLQIISGVLDHRLGLDAVHDAPRWGSRPGTAPWMNPPGSPYVLRLEEPLARTIGPHLESRGHTIEVAPACSIGSSKAIMIEPASRSLLGAADRRREGYAIGW